MPSVRALPATTGAGTASHVRVQDRLRSGGQALREHGEQALLLVHVGMPAHVPGHDLLARHVVHGRKIRLAARDLELGDIGPELGERTLGVEVAFEQVMHVATRLAPVRAVSPPRVRGADPAPEPHAAHDPEHALGRHPPAELVDQAHAHLPVAAPVGGPSPDLAHQRLEVGPCHMRRVRQVVVVRGARQPGYPQEMVEPVSLPCEQSDDGASLASRDLFARRPGVFPGTRPSPSDRRPVRRAPARASVWVSAWTSRPSACPWALA